MERVISSNGVVYYRSKLIPCPHGFSTRIGGVSTFEHTESLNLGIGRGDEDSTVIKNLELFSSSLGIDPKTVISATQIHSDTIRTVSAENGGEGYYYLTQAPCDGYIAYSKNIAPGIRTADCVPILLYAPPQNGLSAAVAAIHAGWRGTLQAIARKAVLMMTDKGILPETVIVAIGPAIGRCCYEVSSEIFDAFSNNFGKEKMKPFFVPSNRDGHYMADLIGINRQILIDSGIKTLNIDMANKCTFCSPDEFYSHRYSQDKRGTMLALISL